MNTNTNPQPINPERIAVLLTRAAGQLDAGTVTALRRARNIALERQAQRKPAFALSTGHGAHWPAPHSTHQWAATAILLMTLLAAGMSYCHHADEYETSHLDVAILTDDLPMEVFVDR